MLRNAQYIWDNNLIADEVHSTLQHARKAQVGVDCTIRNVQKLKDYGCVFKDKSKVSSYSDIPMKVVDGKVGWLLSYGTYIVDLNEGVKLGPNDTGFFIKRSSLNRSGVGVEACVFDPGYTTQDGDVINTTSVRLTVMNTNGFFVERNARICQFIVVDNESCDLYDGQYQGGRKQSKLVKKEVQKGE